MRRNRILQLLNDNRAAARQFNIVANADNEVTIYLYDVIVQDDWFGGVAAEQFVRELAGITADVIHLRINSPGGDVFGARAMEAALRGHSAKIVAHIDGLAASAASFLLMAADEIEIADGGFVMIHNAWTIAWGNAADMRSQADLLDKIDATLVKTYADRTGKPADEITSWMAAETWFNADEAIANGFADRKAEFGNAQASQANARTWNLGAFSNAPQPPASSPALAPAARQATPTLPPPPDFAAMRRRLDLANRT
ncbi:head maturation protease, ClpP-related [Ralstonia pseudosolanacearum]|uniref:head maturation protease, ClpP-related n=1 Tax=Ralstonia pseudosolanacearum TaxID=1310165 RepID=UPI0023DAF7F3|nr:head maturation protease, ClpP-related [Ralstonia pseudosolanacearum]